MEKKRRNLKEIEAQRSDVIDKLRKIEEKKTTVSIEVYTKVKKDYENKLKKIEDKLTEHIDAIKEEVNDLKGKEEELLGQQKEINLKVEEIELRYSIGEYNDESFKKMRKENDEGLKVLSAELQKLRDQIKWYEDFVEIKGLEESLELKKEVEPQKELEIEEHILEEKPAEGIKLNEILVHEEAVKPEVLQDEEITSEQPVEPKKEKGVPCPKCGFVNTPDSWYCEKCGAEILNSMSK